MIRSFRPVLERERHTKSRPSKGGQFVLSKGAQCSATQTRKFFEKQKFPTNKNFTSNYFSRNFFFPKRMRSEFDLNRSKIQYVVLSVLEWLGGFFPSLIRLEQSLQACLMLLKRRFHQCHGRYQRGGLVVSLRGQQDAALGDPGSNPGSR